MKEINLIENAIRSTNEESTRLMLEQFLRANTVVRDEKLDLTKFVSKDEQKPAMTGILHENGLKIATDGSILVAIYSHYKAELEGKVISPKGHIIDERFPNWKLVLPTMESLKAVRMRYLIESMLRKIKQTETIAKIDNKKVFVSFSFDNEKLFFRSDYFTKFLAFIRTFPGVSMGVMQEQFIYASKNNNLCLLMAFSALDDCIVLDF